MEKELQKEVQKIYNCSIDIKFRDFGIYDVYAKIDDVLISVPYLSNVRLTIEQSAREIEEKLDREIIGLFKK